jgi:hypothetical protein
MIAWISLKKRERMRAPQSKKENVAKKISSQKAQERGEEKERSAFLRGKGKGRISRRLGTPRRAISVKGSNRKKDKGEGKEKAISNLPKLQWNSSASLSLSFD